MGHQSSRLKFAVVGHQDNWQKISGFVNSIRFSKGNGDLSLEKIRDIYDYFPPSKLFDVQINSKISGIIEGFYIESFMSPDHLGQAHIWNNLMKTKIACEKAASMGADVVSLGGFTSIVLESGNENFTQINGTKFTTGNTLTAAFISDSIQKASKKWNRPLSDSNLLVIGSTGDIGSACVSFFSNKVKKIMLNARQPRPLKIQEMELQSRKVNCEANTNLLELLPEADLIICVASSILPEDYLKHLKSNVIVCDAGYPKNLTTDNLKSGQIFYAGGMGLVENGYRFFPEHFQKNIYDFPLPNISHGCTMESVVLALEGQSLSFSQGRGNIQIEKREYILQAASKHGIVTAPFFNSSGPLN